MEFEWDDVKAANNLRDHGVSFAQATGACRDPFAVEWIDDRRAYGEERIILLGMHDGQILTSSTRNGTRAFGSSRRAGLQSMSRTSTFARMRRDGTLIRVNPDGSGEALPVEPPAPMSAADIEAAAAARSRRAAAHAESDFARLRRVPRVKTLRRALGLTQEEFAARYHIPLGTLRDWEQGRTEPDQPARAYLRVIARNPEGVFRDLQGGPTPAK